MSATRHPRPVAIAVVLVASLGIAVSALARPWHRADPRGHKHHRSHGHVVRARMRRDNVAVHRFHVARTSHFAVAKRGSLAIVSVSWTKPTDGATVTGQLNERAGNCVVSASSVAGIDHVSFYLDGNLLNTQLHAPYACVWDTSTAVDGSQHTLKAVADDKLGDSASASVRVTVRNSGDTTPPDTTITGGPSGTINSSSASFSFSSSESGSSFECSLDGGAWGSCASPKAYSELADGAHTFQVRATDVAGNTDPSPAARSFTVDSGGGGAGAGYPSLARVDWSGSFDSGCQLVGSAPGAWDQNETNTDYTGGSTTIERSVVGEGSCAAKFANSPSSHMTRSELQRSATGADPELTYEVLAYVPSGQTFSKGGDITQTKQDKCYDGGWMISDGTGATGGGLEYRTVFACTSPQTNGQQVFHAGALPRDRWFALKVHERFSNDPQVGFIQAWIDADGPGPGGYAQAIPMTHVDNEVGPSQDVRLRIGLYRQDTGSANALYMDGFRLQCSTGC